MSTADASTDDEALAVDVALAAAVEEESTGQEADVEAAPEAVVGAYALAGATGPERDGNASQSLRSANVPDPVDLADPVDLPTDLRTVATLEAFAPLGSAVLAVEPTANGPLQSQYGNDDHTVITGAPLQALQDMISTLALPRPHDDDVTPVVMSNQVAFVTFGNGVGLAAPSTAPAKPAPAPGPTVADRLRAAAKTARWVAGRRVELSALQMCAIVALAIAVGGFLFGGRTTPVSTPVAVTVTPKPMAAPGPVSEPPPTVAAPAPVAPVVAQPASPAHSPAEATAIVAQPSTPRVARVRHRNAHSSGRGSARPPSTKTGTKTPAATDKAPTRKLASSGWVDPFGQ